MLAPFVEEVDSSSPYAEFEENEDGYDDKIMGKKGFWHNPNAKWDWYQIGGRWSGFLKLKENKYGELGQRSWTNEDVEIGNDRADQALVNDCDFSENKDEYNHAIRFWEVAIEHSPLKGGEKEEDFRTFWKESYYTDKYKTKENYAKSCSEFSTFAFLTDDGEWNEEGEMGWFGCSSTTNESLSEYQDQFKEYLKYAMENNLYITIVDCHI